MSRSGFLILFQFIIVSLVSAQGTDTLPANTDTLVQPAIRNFSNDTVTAGDSLRPVILSDSSWRMIAAIYPGKDFIRHAWQNNKFFGFSSQPIVITSNKKVFNGKEVLFYSFIALLLFFAFIRVAFFKYVGDLFQVAFRTTMKQRQIGEQLIQTPLPSMLLNFFFLITAALYINFLLKHYHLGGGQNFWLLGLYAFAFLCVIYLIKFLSLKFSGWLFNISDTTNAYIFIVFMINKIIGIYLLPFLILLAFTSNGIYQSAFTLSYIGIFGLLAYRVILAYGLVRNQIRINPFQFFLYLCAFEIAPLLLIYKVLLLWL